MNRNLPVFLQVTTATVPVPVAIASLITIAILLISTIVWLALTLRARRLVSQSSVALRELDALNQRYSARAAVHPQLRFDFRHSANSKSGFDRFDLNAYMRDELLKNQAWFTQEIAKRLSAIDEFQGYVDASMRVGTKWLGESNHARLTPEKFMTIEKKLFCGRALTYPHPSASVTFTVTYTSPQGQNSYARHLSCDFNHIRAGLHTALDTRARQTTVQALRQRERSLMTPGLRVQVLRRDGNRCRMCGVSVNDGATLHIDHILPVSRGGKTVAENLQALCDSCNLGKSNRFAG